MAARSALAASVALLLSVPAADAAGFSAGQRWNCVTDQGKDAALEIHSVEGDFVVFSWMVLEPEGGPTDTLCRKREHLDAQEMAEFCREVGAAASERHRKLREACPE